MQTIDKAKSLSFSIRPDVYTRIDSYCAERGCTRSWFLNKAVELYLANCLEDKSDYETAVAAWDDYEKSGRKSYSSTELRKEFGL